MVYLAYATMWIATAVAVIAGMYMTGSTWCLWAMLIPTLVDASHRPRS